MMKKCSCGKASETEPEMPKRFRVLFLRNDKNCSVEIVETDQLSFEALLHRIECEESVFISQNTTRKRHKQIYFCRDFSAGDRRNNSCNRHKLARTNLRFEGVSQRSPRSCLWRYYWKQFRKYNAHFGDHSYRSIPNWFSCKHEHERFPKPRYLFNNYELVFLVFLV